MERSSGSLYLERQLWSEFLPLTCLLGSGAQVREDWTRWSFVLLTAKAIHPAAFIHYGFLCFFSLYSCEQIPTNKDKTNEDSLG